MIWTTIFQGDFFSLETNFGTTPYLRERSLLRITIERDRNANIEIYYPDIDQRMAYDKGDGVVIIDITDYVRAYPQPSAPISVTYFDDATDFSYSASYFMDVDKEIIPILNYPTDGIVFMPPSVFLDGLWNVPAKYEMYIEDTYVVVGRDEYVFRDGFCMFDKYGRYSIYGDNIDGVIAFNPKPLLCNRQYALVQWQSRFGNTKRATWEVAEVKHSATDVVELVNIYGGWKSRKGSEVSVILRLRDLTPYDYWYYSDIITSNDVRVALNEIDKDLDDSTIVDFVTKSATVQNSGVKTLEVELKYRKYECPI